jgi:hypothetical protein
MMPSMLTVKVFRTPEEQAHGLRGEPLPLDQNTVWFFPNITGHASGISSEGVLENFHAYVLDEDFNEIQHVKFLKPLIWGLPQGAAHVAETAWGMPTGFDWNFLRSYV